MNSAENVFQNFFGNFEGKDPFANFFEDDDDFFGGFTPMQFPSGFGNMN